MRKLKSIVAQVPINQKGEFDMATLSEYSDIATANLMSTMTKGLDMISEMTESLKFNQMGNENNRGGGRSGAGINLTDMLGMHDLKKARPGKRRH